MTERVAEAIAGATGVIVTVKSVATGATATRATVTGTTEGTEMETTGATGTQSGSTISSTIGAADAKTSEITTGTDLVSRLTLKIMFRISFRGFNNRRDSFNNRRDGYNDSGKWPKGGSWGNVEREVNAGATA